MKWIERLVVAVILYSVLMLILTWVIVLLAKMKGI